MKSFNEEFCKAKFDDFLHQHSNFKSVSWEDGDEPPDYYLSANNIRYAVEVTTLMQKVDVGTKKPLPVSVIRDWLEKFIVDEVEAVARKNGFLQGAYLVSFLKPITNFLDIKSPLQSELLSYIFTTQTASKAFPKVVYKSSRQKCQIEKIHNEENKVVMGGPVIAKWANETFAEAKQLFENRLAEKQYRLRNVIYPKILLLQNKYPFANLTTYKSYISITPFVTSFHTIFIVESNSDGQILYSQELTWI